MYLEVKDLKKSYGEGGGYVQVLKGITAGVEQGEMCVIQGTSGSGKSTLLNCIGGLDTVDSGSIVVDGQEVAGLNSKALSNYRREKLGFIFQFYNLVPNLTVKENIQVCQEKVAAKSHVILNHYDALLAQENDEGKCKKLQEEANEKTAQMLREAAADTLDKVLYELSGQMKNAYARSDA